MKVLAIVCAFSALLASASAELKPLFHRSTVPDGWTKQSLAKQHEKVHFHVAIHQQNLDQLEKKFWSVSDPESDDYLNFLSPHDIQAMVAPKAESREAVLNWLESNGIKEYADFVDSIEGWTTVENAKKMFHAEFYTFKHESGKKAVKAFGQVHIDDKIHDHIDAVFGISDFPIPHYTTKRTVKSSADSPTDIVIPQTIWNLYSMPTNIPVGISLISQGVIEFSDQFFSPDDLSTWSKNVNVEIPTVEQANIIGTNDPTSPGMESSLDIQFIEGVNPSATNWFWIEDDDVWLYGWATHFMNTTDVPDIISISYGWWEGGQCDDNIGAVECQKYGLDTVSFVQRVNTEFQKMGVRGVSVFVASGDSGAHTRTDEACEQPRTLAAFPASSPYVTSVGATEVSNPTYFDSSFAPVCGDKTLNYECVKSGTEIAVDYTTAGFTSGGGFSNLSAQPDFQKDIVAAYLKSGVKLPPASYFNHSGRAFPDVSAVGHNGYILLSGAPWVSGGTSESAPTFAAVASLLAQAFRQKTGQSFGYMNPLLYAAYEADPTHFIDVTIGDNICTEAGCAPTCQGYKATKGWDPVTGLGSPNYESLLGFIHAVADKHLARKHNKNNLYTSAF